MVRSGCSALHGVNPNKKKSSTEIKKEVQNLLIEKTNANKYEFIRRQANSKKEIYCKIY